MLGRDGSLSIQLAVGVFSYCSQSFPGILSGYILVANHIALS